MTSPHPAGHEVIGVEVPGGRLAVETFTSGTEPILAIHGVSSQRRLWNWLRAAEPGLSLVAPDLRGRGDSVGVRGASSIGRHAADMIAVLDHLGLGAAHVCGMSMGGFVAVELATTYPDRVKSLILVDGGFPMAPPPGVTLEKMPALIAEDRLARMDSEWPSLRDYAVFFTWTAPLLDVRDPLLLDYLAHDLDGRHVRLDSKAMFADITDIFFGSSKWQQLRVPIRLLTAEWSISPDGPPAYPAEAVAGFRDALGALLTVRPVAGVDHAASIMTMTGARVTADLIVEAISREVPA
jgi:pimeloyl-ACP methyl ester carboxylesterase